MSTESLLSSAYHELNGRQRGREARVQRLQAAGVPTDHVPLAAWVADTERRKAAELGFWFKGDSIRVYKGKPCRRTWSIKILDGRPENGRDDALPVFGKFAAIVRLATISIWHVRWEVFESDESGDLWTWSTFGDCAPLSGSMYTTKEQAREAGFAALGRQGYTPDVEQAEKAAIAMAKSRHMGYTTFDTAHVRI